jgi:Fic family protein
MSTRVAYRWQPIKDYDVAPDTLAKPELHNLVEIWAEQRHVLEQSEGLKAFNERLRREWAIETGLLERIYTLDRGVTQMLIERGIDAAYIGNQTGTSDPDRVIAIIRDHEDAIEGLFAFVRGDRALSTSYIKELHAQLTRNQETTTAMDSLGRLVDVPLLRGAYKTQPNNPLRRDGAIHEYCPPEHVAAEMDRLIQLHKSHTSISPEVEAAWLHHRFTQIHPFQDGNGRVARCLATLVFIRANWFPLVIRDTREERERYLDALESADAGDDGPLVSVFAASQKRAFVQALGISGQVLRLTRAEQVVTATRDLLAEREKTRRAEWERAKITAKQLQGIAATRLGEIAVRLADETRPYLSGARFNVDSEFDGGQRGHYFRWQIIETAKHLDYFANTAEYRAWTRPKF